MEMINEVKLIRLVPNDVLNTTVVQAVLKHNGTEYTSDPIIIETDLLTSDQEEDIKLKFILNCKRLDPKNF